MSILQFLTEKKFSRLDVFGLVFFAVSSAQGNVGVGVAAWVSLLILADHMEAIVEKDLRNDQ